MFERWGRSRYEGIDTELRGILKEKGLRKDDPFDDIVHRSLVIDINRKTDFENVVHNVAMKLENVIKLDSKEIVARVMEGTRVGATPVTHSFALPHFRVEGIDHPEIVLVRSKPGISIEVFDPLSHEVEEVKIVHGLFFLVSPENNPTQHLRILAKIAGRVDDDDFLPKWETARDEHELQESILYDEQFLSVLVSKQLNTGVLIGKEIKSLLIPDGCLVTTIRRDGKAIIPKGFTVIKEQDRLIIMGDPNGINEFRKTFINS